MSQNTNPDPLRWYISTLGHGGLLMRTYHASKRYIYEADLVEAMEKRDAPGTEVNIVTHGEIDQRERA
jgi:hypothetical protein